MNACLCRIVFIIINIILGSLTWLRWMINNGRKKLFSLLPILRISMFLSTSRGFSSRFYHDRPENFHFLHSGISRFFLKFWHTPLEFQLHPLELITYRGGSHIAKTSFKMSFFICITFYWEALGNNYFYIACPFLS